MGPLHVVQCRVAFGNESDLKQAFACIRRYVPADPHSARCEFFIDLEWTSQTLTKGYQRLVIEQLRALQNSSRGIGATCYFPFCLNDALKLATFPNCDACVYAESQWCLWQNRRADRYHSAQKPFHAADWDCIVPDDFRAGAPLTWFTPLKAHIDQIVCSLAHCELLVDFGCGNGFVDYLLLREGFTGRVVGIDPLVTPSLQHPRFDHSPCLEGSLPRIDPERTAVLCSLGDYQVPLQQSLKRVQPAVLVLILIPESFGRGGSWKQLRFKGGELSLVEERALFSLATLEDLGYTCTHREPVPSYFRDSTELRIYTKRGENTLLPLPVSESETASEFPWEKHFFKSNSHTSTELRL